jgi:hypothetical protein
MGIIDFRCRPLYKHYQTGFDKDTVHKFLTSFGYEETESLIKRDVPTLLKEMTEAGIEKAVVPGRVTYGTTNEELYEILDLAPDRFIIYPFLDITDPEQALKDIDTYIINGRGQGASYEPLWGNDWKFDDERIFPIYKKLEENHIPLLANVSQLAGPVIDNTIPAQIDRVLNAFPNLVYIAGHSGWPWLNEMISLTFKHENLYLTADFNGTRGAGADLLRHAALYMAKDQVVFASSYPFGPIAGGIQSVKDWNLPAELEAKVLRGNAAKILNLD